MAPNDLELITQAQQGVFSAFEQLVYRYDQQVLTIAARYVHNAEDAKDIYQEVFIRVYRGLARFRKQSEFSTWLYRIVTNVCLTHRQWKKRHHHESLSESGTDDETEGGRAIPEVTGDEKADAKAMESEISERIERALQHLSPQQRIVFTLRHYQDYKIKDIAVMMKCSEGTVKKYLFIATGRMRKQLTDFDE